MTITEATWSKWIITALIVLAFITCQIVPAKEAGSEWLPGEREAFQQTESEKVCEDLFDSWMTLRTFLYTPGMIVSVSHEAELIALERTLGRLRSDYGTGGTFCDEVSIRQQQKKERLERSILPQRKKK